MNKKILLTAAMALAGFSNLVQAALVDVASIEFSVNTLGKSPVLSLSEVILLEKDTGLDLALASAGATASIANSAVKKNNNQRVNTPALVIDGVSEKKSAYRFIKGKRTSLPVLRVDLGQVSTIDALNVFGRLGKENKVNKGFLGINFLDSDGNSIYEIANLAQAFTDSNNAPLILPDLSAPLSGGAAASAVPVPAAVWLFGSGLIGVLGLARRKTSNC